MIPRTLDQYVSESRRLGRHAEQHSHGAFIACPVCDNGQLVHLREEYGIPEAQCPKCGAYAIDIALALETLGRQNGSASAVAEQPSPGYRLLTTAELGEAPPPTWLVEPYIPEGALVILFGASGSYKSFAAVDLAARAPGTTVYLAGEGGAGALYKRARAWETAAGHEADIRWLPEPVDLLDGREMEAFAAAMRSLDPPPRLIVVDTAARAMRGDENDTGDMGRLVAALDRYRTEFHAAVLCVHHSGHGNQDRERGSSGLPAAADVRIRAKSTGPLRVRLDCVKMRDAEPFEPVVCRLEPVEGSLVIAEVATPAESLERQVEAYLDEHPDASQRAVEEAVTGRAEDIRAAYKRVRPVRPTPGRTPGQGASQVGVPIGTHLAQSPTLEDGGW